MASIIRLCPLSGGAGEETPHCYVLEVDQFTFLLDCGWDPNFSQDIVVQLKKYAHKIDAVLLSHPDILHIGLLPYAVNKLGLSCPIFATGAVHKMGEMFLYDLYQSRRNMEDFDLFTLDDVDKTTKIITDLRYIAHLSLKIRESLFTFSLTKFFRKKSSILYTKKKSLQKSVKV